LTQDEQHTGFPAESGRAAVGVTEPESQRSDGTAEPLDEKAQYADDGIYDDAEQGFVHIQTTLFAVGATIVSLVVLALLAGNVYQFIHYRNDNTVATVNGAPISKTEFLRSAGQQDQALQSLIDQKLIQQEAKKEKVTVPDSEVDSEVGTIKQQLGSDKEFNAALQRANLSEPQLRDQIRTQKLATAMGARNVTVSDDDAQAFYNQNKAQFGSQSFDQAKDQIKTQLLQQKRNEAIQTWIAGLRSKAKIVIRIPA
jgi:parvulin-like peptidyl-prolyl isomerase